MLKPALAATLALLLAAPAAADTLIHNVNGIQVGPDRKLQRFESLLIGDDGKVIQTFTAVQNPHAPGAARIDGGGRTLLPGLIDAHGHVIEGPGGSSGLGLSAIRLDLLGTGSLEALQARLKDHAARSPRGWILGRGWNQELWPDKRFPTAADLDAIVADRPVWLERVDGHAAVANSVAMKAAGITAETRDPAGGRIERDARGNPTGVFIDTASELVDRVVPRASTEDRERGLAAAQDILLRNGITAVADMGTSAENWRIMVAAAQSGRLKLRIMAYSDGVEAMKAIARMSPTLWEFGDRLRMGGVKLYADGALGSRGAWLKRPYADKPDSRGLRFLTDAELRKQADYVSARGYQLAIHAIGDAANAQVVSVFEDLARTWGPKRRWRIEHVQVIDPADIPRLAPAGIIASMQPVHQTSDRLMAEKRLDPPRLAGAYAWRSIERSGALLAFGSDFPVESPNPFPGLAAAISRQDMDGQPPGGWRREEAVSFETALAGFTRNAAFAGYADSRIGALEPGKWADFILVDRDPTKVDPQALARTQVLETWIAGKKVWSRAPSASATERGK